MNNNDNIVPFTQSAVRNGNSGGPGGPGNMERRVENLEKVTVGIRETLARLDARTDALKEHNASKADMSDLKSSLIQWFVGTAIAMTALASAISFGLARFLQ